MQPILVFTIEVLYASYTLIIKQLIIIVLLCIVCCDYIGLELYISQGKDSLLIFSVKIDKFTQQASHDFLVTHQHGMKMDGYLYGQYLIIYVHKLNKQLDCVF